MKKFLKYLLYIVVGIFALIGAVVVIASITVWSTFGQEKKQVL